MKTFKQFILEAIISSAAQKVTVAKLNKSGGYIYSDIYYTNGKENVLIGINRDIYFLIMGDGSFERIKATSYKAFRKQADKQLHKYTFIDDSPEVIDNSRLIRSDNYMNDLEKMYKVKMTSVSDAYNQPSYDEHDYDLGTLFPEIIKRKDGKQFDITDIENMKIVQSGFNSDPYIYGFKLVIHAKAGQKEARGMVEFV